MIADVPPAIVAKGEVLARSLMKNTNADFNLTGSPWRAANPLCQSRRDALRVQARAHEGPCAGDPFLSELHHLCQRRMEMQRGPSAAVVI